MVTHTCLKPSLWRACGRVLTCGYRFRAPRGRAEHMEDKMNNETNKKLAFAEAQNKLSVMMYVTSMINVQNATPLEYQTWASQGQRRYEVS